MPAYPGDDIDWSVTRGWFPQVASKSKLYGYSNHSKNANAISNIRARWEQSNRTVLSNVSITFKKDMKNSLFSLSINCKLVHFEPQQYSPVRQSSVYPTLIVRMYEYSEDIPSGQQILLAYYRLLRLWNKPSDCLLNDFTFTILIIWTVPIQ